MFLWGVAISLLPVLLFLAGLVVLDSYKLTPTWAVARTILFGAAVAGGCLFINGWLLELTGVAVGTYSRYLAPVVEESLKALPIVFLLRSQRIGFLVDAAIYGFALGAGFACVENLHYLVMLRDPAPVVWVVRGFGTAAIHGTATAMFGIISQSFAERNVLRGWATYGPGIVFAIVTHSIFNHFLLSPALTTLAVVIVLPVAIIAVYRRSETATRVWLGAGLDADMELVRTLVSGQVTETRIGQYLESLKSKFPGKVVGDMLCFILLHAELAVRAKGILMLREAGITPPPDAEVEAKFRELRFLKRSIGRTGILAILPVLRTSSRALWHVHAK